jgi:hypothetical protein
MVIINILLAFFKHFSEMFQHFQKCSNIFQKCWFHQLFVEHFCKNVAIFFLEMMEHFLKKTSACWAADRSTASARGREGGCGSGRHGRPRRSSTHAAMAGVVELGPQPWSAARGARSALGGCV